MDRKCVQCGRLFSLSQSEIDFFKSKGLSLPKRCKECRQKNKSSGASPTSSDLWKYSTSSGYNSYYVRNTNMLAVIVSFLFMVFCALSLFSSIFKGHLELIIAPLVFLVIGAIIFVASICNSRVLVEEFDTKEYKHTFYDTSSMTEHYVKHGKETHSISMEDYLTKANSVIADSNCRTKTIQNGDRLYCKPQTNEFVVIAKAGYIRTYFIANSRYYYRQ